MRFQKSQAAGTATLVPPSASAGSFSNTCELPWPVRGDMKKGVEDARMEWRDL
jgi:hypothetical protein